MVNEGKFEVLLDQEKQIKLCIARLESQLSHQRAALHHVWQEIERHHSRRAGSGHRPQRAPRSAPVSAADAIIEVTNEIEEQFSVKQAAKLLSEIGYTYRNPALRAAMYSLVERGFLAAHRSSEGAVYTRLKHNENGAKGKRISRSQKYEIALAVNAVAKDLRGGFTALQVWQKLSEQGLQYRTQSIRDVLNDMAGRGVIAFHRNIGKGSKTIYKQPDEVLDDRQIE